MGITMPLFYCSCGDTIAYSEGTSPKCPTCSRACVHRQHNSVCEIASEIASIPCTTTIETCAACLATSRPRRLNIHTLTLAYAHNQQIDMQHCQEVIDGSASGFGTRLANTIGLILKEDASSSCGCAGHKDILDVWTKDYIRTRMDTVLDWLQNKAYTRHLPFSRSVTRCLLQGLLALSS